MYDRRPERGSLGLGAAEREGLIDGAFRLGDMSSEKALLFPELFSDTGDSFSLPARAIAGYEAFPQVGFVLLFVAAGASGRKRLLSRTRENVCVTCGGSCASANSFQGLEVA